MAKTRLHRTQSYRIVGTRGKPQLLGKRCRVLLIDDAEDRETFDGFLQGLDAYMLSGPQAGGVISLPPCKLKPVKSRTCECRAYSFPHAPGQGACKSPVHEPEPGMEIDLASLFTKEKSQ